MMHFVLSEKTCAYPLTYYKRLKISLIMRLKCDRDKDINFTFKLS